MRIARPHLLTTMVLALVAGCGDAGVLGPEPVREARRPVAEDGGLRVPAPSALAFGAPAAPAGCLSEGTAFGDWQVRYHGYGCVAVEASAGSDAASTLFMTPTEAMRAEETHAPLVLGPMHGDQFLLRTSLETVQHTRRADAPNPWEVGWVVWQYQDDAHFYYFIPKPNGWELGKRDPAYPGGQRFLATGNRQVFPIGQVHHVTVRQIGSIMTVTVNGEPIVQFRDDERPYRSGRFALYAEDAAIRVHRVAAL
jgi:hypothetical protein